LRAALERYYLRIKKKPILPVFCNDETFCIAAISGTAGALGVEENGEFAHLADLCEIKMCVAKRNPKD
jgi:ribosomal protein L24E